MMKKKQAKFLSFTSLSLLLHLLFFGGLILLENSIFLSELSKLLDHTVVDKTKDVVTQIELIDLEEEMMQIVQQSEKSVDETEPEDAKFLSIKNQNIEKETKSALNGKFNNASNIPEGAAPRQAQKAQQQNNQTGKKKVARQTSPSPQPKAQKQNQAAQPVKEKNFGLNGLTPSFNPTQALNKQFTQQPQESSPAQQNTSRNLAQQQAASPGGDGISQTDDHLEDIEVGAQTLLKTKEYKYYSFYARVREQLRSNWNPLIRQKVSFLYSTGRARELASNPTKKTSVRVTLNEDGYLESIELLRTSGVTTIDRAAIDAFRAAAPFPNPPDGMKEKDDKVRIFWDFVLET